MSISALTLAAVAILLNLLAWQIANPAHSLPAWSERVHGLAYSGFRIGQDPTKERFPSEEQLTEDMALLARYTERIRTYSSLQNASVPRIASDYGLKVTAGAWLDQREDNNTHEIAALVAEARRNPAVRELMVGNESILRGDLQPKQLVQHIKQVKASVKKPVSTAEPWHVWLKHPELARNVDFITVHLLPYWEGVPVEAAVDYVFERLDQLRTAYPKKRIVIGEVGWPSVGDRREAARASLERQALFVRTFLERSADRKLEYFFMEAFDQPWKVDHEGRAGAYWGLFNADRTPKFALDGPVHADPNWRAKALASALLALPLMLWFGARFRRFRLIGRLFFSALIQAGVAIAVWLACLPFDHYLGWFDLAMLTLLLPALIAMIAILLVNGFEFTEALWNRGWQRAFRAQSALPAEAEPFVSIHLACHNEPPEMVIATLESLARLDYSRFEVLVVDNNTQDAAVWRPVEVWCATAGERFRFFHLEDWPGFKAGALNFALEQTSPRAEVIGVVDADYVVARDWLRALVPHFRSSPNVAVVQSPQAHREFEGSLFQSMCNWEFEGFFRIGMHHRNERNAIIQHGTMTLVQAAALRTTGGWSEWCLCEDAELGLRLMRHGYETRYVDQVFGRGLAPADFKAFKAQRMRWAFGAMQILKTRWDWLTGKRYLEPGQRYHFLTGWFSWFADALHLVFTTAALVWTAAMLAFPKYVTVPLTLFLVPVLGFFVCKALFGPVLYAARVKCRWRDLVGASVASMGLSHAIARGVFDGLTQKRGRFIRTTKGVHGAGWLGTFAPVREELLILAAIALAAAGVVMRMGSHHLEAMLWVAVLAAQSLPYLAACVCALIAAHATERAKRVARAERPSATVIAFPPLAPVTRSARAIAVHH